MPQPLVVALPPDTVLGDGCIIRVAALNPTTGNIVTAVNVSNVSLEVDQLSGGSLNSGPFVLVPGPGA